MKFVLCLLFLAFASGCTSVQKTSDAATPDGKQAVAEAPLGSRIRQKAGAQPVDSAKRDDMDTMRVSQGAQISGAYNKN